MIYKIEIVVLVCLIYMITIGCENPSTYKQLSYDFGFIYYTYNVPKPFAQQMIAIHSDAYLMVQNRLEIDYSMPILTYLISNTHENKYLGNATRAISASSAMWINADNYSYFYNDENKLTFYNHFGVFSAISHEMTHLMADQYLGMASLIFLEEGLAVLIGNDWIVPTYDDILTETLTYTHLHGNRLTDAWQNIDLNVTIPDIETALGLSITDFYGGVASLQNHIHYAMAGSFVGYLWFTFGAEKFLHFYQTVTYDTISQVFHTIYDLPIQTVEHDWIQNTERFTFPDKIHHTYWASFLPILIFPNKVTLNNKIIHFEFDYVQPLEDWEWYDLYVNSTWITSIPVTDTSTYTLDISVYELPPPIDDIVYYWSIGAHNGSETMPPSWNYTFFYNTYIQNSQ